MAKSLRKSNLVLLRMLGLFVIGAIVIYWQREYLIRLYFENQLTQVGWFVNGAILILFLSGIIRLVQLFVQYDREEAILDRFTEEVARAPLGAKEFAVPSNTIIGRRYNTVVDFNRARTEINHNALAATLLAQETSRTSFPKFVNNVLILTGVFGTIVSLTVALLGASSVIEQTENVAGLNTVIHGMSTALSTTMTAILSYFFFAYFYLKLLDTQSHVLGRVEHVSATLLIPRFQVSTRSPEQNLNELMVMTTEALSHIDQFVQAIDQVNMQQNDRFQQIGEIMEQNSRMLEDVKDILRDGFRLGDTEDRNR